MNYKSKFQGVFRVVLLLALILNIFTFIGCLQNPHVEPELTVSENIKIDLESEKFYVYENVSATDGNGTNVTDKIQVELDEGVEIADGAAVFPTTGEYVFKYSVEDAFGNYSEREITVQVYNIYSVYLTNATMPPLYCALDMASNGYKFIYFNDRTGTVDVTIYGERAIGNYKETQSDYENALNDFYEIYQSDEGSYFRIFIPDARNQNLIKYFIGKGISEDRYEVKYLSDGSMSYSTSFPYRGDNAYEEWEKNTDVYDNMVRIAKEGGELYYNGVTLGASYMSYELHNAYIYAAQKNNAEFWGAFPETLQSSDERVQSEIDKAHLIKKQPELMYNALTSAQKEMFLHSVSFDKNDFDTKYFQANGNYLIITGTSPVTGPFNSEQFIGIINEIRTDFPDYNLLFKPHPVSIPSETVFPEVYSYFMENEIAVLPGRLPMEVISFVYSDALIGGFDSSLYMSVPQGNTAFFIAQSKDSLSAVSSVLYENGAFGNVKFYWI